MRFVLQLIFWLLVAPHAGAVDYAFPGTFFRNGATQVIALPDRGDVYDLLAPRCQQFKTEVHCLEAMDIISWYMYGFAWYTPRLAHRTVEDSTTSRAAVIAHLIQQYSYTKYLEIGCDMDLVFGTIRSLVPVAVGVDPVRGGSLRMTSDAFFAQNVDTFDIIYTDGDHTAVQTLKDVENGLEVLGPNGSIVLHDCNPRFEYRQYRSSEIYNGDVWKVVAALRTRPDLEVVTIDVDHGVGVVRRRPNRHLLPLGLLQKAQASAADPLSAFTYVDLEQHREELLRLMTVADFRAWLAEESILSVTQAVPVPVVQEIFL